LEDIKQETIQLIAYAKVDRDVSRLLTLLETLPPALKTDLGALKDRTSALATLDAQLAGWQTEKLAIETQEAESDALVRSRKDTLNTIHHMKEYQAALKEIEDCNKRGKERMATLIELTEKIDTANAEREALTAEHAELTARVNEQNGAWETEQLAFKREIEEKQHELARCAGNIGETLLKKYLHIAKLRNPALAAAERGVCQECHMQLPPQEYILLQRSQGLSICPSCQRLLYIP